MKTTRTIPTTDIIITAHNKREETIAWIFCHNITSTAEAATEGYSYALDACGEFGTGHVIESAGGYASAMYHLGMIEEPISTIEIAGFMRAAYLEMIGGAENGHA